MIQLPALLHLEVVHLKPVSWNFHSSVNVLRPYPKLREPFGALHERLPKALFEKLSTHHPVSQSGWLVSAAWLSQLSVSTFHRRPHCDQTARQLKLTPNTSVYSLTRGNACCKNVNETACVIRLVGSTVGHGERHAADLAAPRARPCLAQSGDFGGTFIRRKTT